MHYEHVTLRDRGDVLAVYFKKDSILDQQVIDEIGHEFNRVALEAASCRKILLNFDNVKFMSSAMIGKLLLLKKRCTADKIKLKLSNVSAGLFEVFKITKLNKVFDIQPTEAAALDAFEQRGWFAN
jgi:anti-sigma B factor antagonist